MLTDKYHTIYVEGRLTFAYYLRIYMCIYMYTCTLHVSDNRRDVWIITYEKCQGVWKIWNLINFVLAQRYKNYLQWSHECIIKVYKWNNKNG